MPNFDDVDLAMGVAAVYLICMNWMPVDWQGPAQAVMMGVFALARGRKNGTNSKTAGT